jgi:hypothetical protein
MHRHLSNNNSFRIQDAAHLDNIDAPSEVTHVDEIRLSPTRTQSRVLQRRPPLVKGSNCRDVCCNQSSQSISAASKQRKEGGGRTIRLVIKMNLNLHLPERDRSERGEFPAFDVDLRARCSLRKISCGERLE